MRWVDLFCFHNLASGKIFVSNDRMHFFFFFLNLQYSHFWGNIRKTAIHGLECKRDIFLLLIELLNISVYEKN